MLSIVPPCDESRHRARDDLHRQGADVQDTNGPGGPVSAGRRHRRRRQPITCSNRPSSGHPGTRRCWPPPEHHRLRQDPHAPPSNRATYSTGALVVDRVFTRRRNCSELGLPRSRWRNRPTAIADRLADALSMAFSETRTGSRGNSRTGPGWCGQTPQPAFPNSWRLHRSRDELARAFAVKTPGKGADRLSVGGIS
jgi:hypothetical protein